MLLKRIIILVIVGLTACARSDNGASPADAADIVFRGSNIITVDEAHAGATAVAVKGTDIVAVGSVDDVSKLVGDATRVVELGDRALVPGFIDAHGHMAFVARLVDFANLSSPPVGPVETIDDLVRILTQHIEASGAAPGEWVYGYGYDDSLLAENRHPNRDDLDRASTQHPIALMHVSGHLAAVNSAALAAKNVNSLSENPPGGVIRRRPGTSEPNGVMEELAAFQFVMNDFDKIDPARLQEMVRESVDIHASFGITTIQDGASTLADVTAMTDAAASKPFNADVVAFPMATTLDDETLDSIQPSAGYVGGFRVGGIKFMLDGSPQGRTAYLSEPYAEGPPGADADYRAYPAYPAEEFNPRIARLIEAGVPTLVHANGDGAIDMLIEGVASALEQTGPKDHRTVVIHAQLTREDQLHRYKELGLVPSYYAVHPFFWGDWHRKSFGDDRALFISPVARTAELGIPFSIHNDSPVVPPDVMRLMWVAVNRKTRSGFVLGADQRATPMQALHAVTLGAAYQYFEEDRKGSITPGKQADLVVLGANPLTVDPDTIKDIQIVETFARGKSIYRNKN
ncbi:MAG: amidohydrolase [Gammaproteobacteria bacterium]|nr:amidohydrolase [Gammaproteobacteria bacterium]